MAVLTPAVATLHEDYSKHVEAIKIARDCVAGSDAVKAEKYLPTLTESGDKNINADYKARADFIGFTAMTHEGMLGMAYRKDPIMKLTPDIKVIEENANGGGLSLDQLSRRVTSDLLVSGRCGLLVDYPETASDITKAEEQSQNIQARIVFYDSESIINWRSEMIGGVKKLVLVVLQEKIEIIEPDGFKSETKDQYRVLRYSVAKGYTYQLYNDKGESLPAGEIPVKAQSEPRDSIPFTFVGSVNNDDQIDRSPLRDLADLNLSHYRSSADFEQSSHYTGQPLYTIKGLDEALAEKYFPNGFTVGSRAIIFLSAEGGCEIVQPDPNIMPSQGMERKEKQMIQLGARLIEERSGEVTATGEAIRFAGQNSKLGILISNVESALNQCLVWVAEFMGGANDKNSIELNREFYLASIDPQTIIALIQAYDRGVIAKSDIRDEFRKAGTLKPDRDDDVIDADVESEPITEEP